MPKLSHEDCRAKLCILCVKKKKDVGPISAAVRAKIVDHIPGLDVNDDPRLPNGICTNDRKALQNAASSKNVLPPKYDYRYSIMLYTVVSSYSDTLGDRQKRQYNRLSL